MPSGQGAGQARRRRRVVALHVFVLLPCLLATAGHPVRAADVFADAVEEYRAGASGGTGADLLPGIVLGPPRGGGDVQGSLDVLSLGIGGSIVLRFEPPVICDRPGPDFTVFENAFHSGSPTGPLFVEYGFVAVSQDGKTFLEFPYDTVTGVGLAGRTPVQSSPENGIDPTDPSVSGGDSFDLATVGLAWARYVRITDVAGAVRDIGDLPQFTVPPNAGFDLDAVATVHACDGLAEPTPTATASPTPTPTVVSTTAVGSPTATVSAPPARSATPTATRTFVAATATASSRPEASPTPAGARPGDVNGDGRVDESDAKALLAESFGAGLWLPANSDVNGDGRLSVADVTAWVARRSG